MLSSEVEGVRPGDKLVSINGDSVVGEALADVLARLRQAFTKDVLRCTPTHCQITKVKRSCGELGREEVTVRVRLHVRVSVDMHRCAF